MSGPWRETLRILSTIEIMRGKKKVGLVKFRSKDDYTIDCEDGYSRRAVEGMIDQCAYFPRFAAGLGNSYLKDAAMKGRDVVWYRLIEEELEGDDE